MCCCTRMSCLDSLDGSRYDHSHHHTRCLKPFPFNNRRCAFGNTAGMFYWIRSVQTYDSDGWNYIDNLKAFVRGGLTDDSFIDGVSGIVNRVSCDRHLLPIATI
jgi:hypothetical protein